MRREDAAPMEMVCPNCLKGNPESAHLCRFCMTPLTSHAATDPILSIGARMDTLAKASQKPRSGIVVLGMWVLLGPVFVIFGAMVVGPMVEVLQGDRDAWGKALGGALCAAVPLLITGVLLWRTTTRYWAQQEVEEEDDDDEEGEEQEEYEEGRTGEEGEMEDGGEEEEEGEPRKE